MPSHRTTTRATGATGARGCALIAVLTIACGDPSGPSEPPPGTGGPADGPLLVGAPIECRVDTTRMPMEWLSCPDQTPSASAGEVVIGTQGALLALNFEEAAPRFENGIVSFTVRVRNVGGQRINAGALRVFIVSGPTNGVEVVDADGIDSLTAPGQPYYEHQVYDGVLDTERPGDNTAARSYRFRLNGAATFAFSAYVAGGSIPRPEGPYAFVPVLYSYPPHNVSLLDVHGAGDVVYAVGDASTLLRVHENGWETVAHGAAGGYVAWRGVHVRPDGEPVVVGDDVPLQPGTPRFVDLWGVGAEQYRLHVSGTSGEATGIQQFDGTNWSWTGPVGIGSYRAGWTAADGETFVVGQFHSTGPDTVPGNVLRLVGGEWHSAAIGTVALNGVHGSASDDVVAVGEDGTILRWNGAAWNQEQSGVTFALRDVWSGGGVGFAVGDEGVVLRYNQGSWQAEAVPTDADLHGVWARAPDEVYVVGAGSTVLRYDGVSWRQLPRLDFPARPTVAFIDDEMFVVGEGQVVYRSASDDLRQPLPVAEPLRGIAGSAADDVWAVGDAGALVHYDGSSWESAARVTEADLNAVWLADSNTGWAVGAGGTMLRMEAGTWQATGTFGSEELHDVWGRGPADVYAVGADGAFAHFDGSGWNALASPTTDTILAIEGTAGGDLVAITATAIHAFDGTGWSTVSLADAGRRLTEVTAAGDSAFLVVGESGLILHGRRSSWLDLPVNEAPHFTGVDFRDGAYVLVAERNPRRDELRTPVLWVHAL